MTKFELLHKTFSQAIDAAISSRRATLVCAIVLFISPAVLLFVVLPGLVMTVAQWTPLAFEHAIVRYALDKSQVTFPETALNAQTVREYTQRVQKLARLSGLNDVEVVFAALPSPNASAHLGNTMRIHDALLDALYDDDLAFDAVVAHELGHMQHRDNLRGRLRFNSIFQVLLRMNGVELSNRNLYWGFANTLASPAYSRAIEAQADEYAAELLAKNGRSSMDFARAMRAMMVYSRARGIGEGGYTATHPDGLERAQRAEQFAPGPAP
jgi:Zn-dependent protease with chaperone function